MEKEHTLAWKGREASHLWTGVMICQPHRVIPVEVTEACIKGRLAVAVSQHGSAATIRCKLSVWHCDILIDGQD